MSERAVLKDARIVAVAPEMADRLVAAVRRFHGESGHAVDSRQAEAVAAICHDPSLGFAWLLTVDGGDRGYALGYRRHSIDHGGTVCVLDDLWVEPALRRRGFGSFLLSAVCDALLEADISAVLLEADPADTGVMAFYAHSGFEPTGTATLQKLVAQD